MSRRTADELFEAWWQRYPKKVGKLAAKRQWDRIRPTPELFDKMLTALAWQEKQGDWRDRQFIPYPATWLCQGRWLDEPHGAPVVPVRAPWVCRHVDPCANREMCQIATNWKRPEHVTNEKQPA